MNIRELETLIQNSKTILRRNRISLEIDSDKQKVSDSKAPGSAELPEDLADYFRDFPNGLLVDWTKKGEVIYQVKFLNWKSSVQQTETINNALKKLAGESPDHRTTVLARRQATRLLIVKLCSYDFFAVECNKSDRNYGSVFLDRHDALDGPKPVDDIKIADSLDTLFREWAKRAFSMHLDWDWTDVWNEKLGKWNSSRFDESFPNS